MQQLNILDPVSNNAEAIVLILKLVTNQHTQMQTYAQTIAFLINSEQQKLEHN